MKIVLHQNIAFRGSDPSNEKPKSEPTVSFNDIPTAPELPVPEQKDVYQKPTETSVKERPFIHEKYNIGTSKVKLPDWPCFKKPPVK